MNGNRLVVWLVVWLGGASLAHGWVQGRTASGVPIAWPRMPIPFHVGKGGSASVTDGSDLQALQDAIGVWSNVACARISFRYEGEVTSPRVEATPHGPNQNHLFWIRSPERWPYPNDVLAATKLTWNPTTGLILDADIAFNDHAFRWSTTTPPQPDHHDVMNTAVHELGHLLGLEHSPLPDATMFADAPPEETKKRDLGQDDREGICAIYPVEGSRFSLVVVDSDDGLRVCAPASGEPQPPAPGCQTEAAAFLSHPWERAILLAFLFVVLLCVRRAWRNVATGTTLNLEGRRDV